MTFSKVSSTVLAAMTLSSKTALKTEISGLKYAKKIRLASAPDASTEDLDYFISIREDILKCK